jgi:hypothetical protein
MEKPEIMETAEQDFLNTLMDLMDLISDEDRKEWNSLDPREQSRRCKEAVASLMNEAVSFNKCEAEKVSEDKIVLNWTKEDHPTRESLIQQIKELELLTSGSNCGGSYEDSPVSFRNLYDAKAKLEIWDEAFGSKMEHLTDFDDPYTIKAAKEKQAHHDATTVPRPSIKEQLATMRPPKDAMGEIVSEYLSRKSKTPELTEGKPYIIESASYVFDSNPKNKIAMGQMRKKFCESNIMEYEDRYLPVSYFVITFTPEKFMKAVELISKDLQTVGEFIVGHLSLPKVLVLSGNKHALYVWPFIDYKRLAESVGKDFGIDFEYDDIELLKFIKVDSAREEGSLGDSDIS